MRIVLLGPPGSGKANVSGRIGEYCNLPVLTCNGVLQRAAAEDSELGRLATEALASNRVSDELLLALLRVRLTQKDLVGGFVLVDFPRNVAQAEVIDGILDTLGLPLDLVVFVSVDSDELMERLVGRIQCDSCGARYNLYINPPMVEGVCDHCGSRVNRRPDDYEETISGRLRVYEGLMGPIIQHYTLHGKLRRIDGNGGNDAVWDGLKKIIDATPRTVLETEPVSEAALPIDAEANSDEEGIEEATEDLVAIVNEKATKASQPSTKAKPAKSQPKAADKQNNKADAKQLPAETKAKAKKPASAKAKAADPTKPASKKSATKKILSKKATPAKATKKAAAKSAKPTAKKALAKKAATKKAAAKKGVTKKAPTKKAVSKKVVGKKASSKKVGAKKTAAKKPVLKKAAARKVAPSSKANKPTGKKVAVKKAASKTKKAPTKKASAKKTRASKPSASKKSTKKSAVKKKSGAKKSRK